MYAGSNRVPLFHACQRTLPSGLLSAVIKFQELFKFAGTEYFPMLDPEWSVHSH